MDSGRQATAHKLACLIYRMLKYGQEYVTQSMEEYQAKVKANMLKALKRKGLLGFDSARYPRTAESLGRRRRGEPGRHAQR